MKALKYLGIGFAASIALLAAVAGIVAATFDPNEYKPQLVELVKQKYGRTLAIEGRVGLEFLPRIGASVKGVTLSEPKSTRLFARVGEASVSLALLPLLSKKVILDRVELAGLDVNLIRFKDGRTNFDDLIGRAGKPAPPSKPEAKKGGEPSAPLGIDISGISLRSSGIGWRDEAEGRTVRLWDVDLTTGRIASGVPGKLSFKGRVQGDSPRVNAEVKLAGGYRFDFDRPAAQLSGLDMKVEGDVAGNTGLKASLSGDVGWAGGNRLDVAKLKLEAASKEGLEARVSAPRLALSPERSESSPIEASVKMSKGPRRIDAKIALAAMKATGQRVDFSSLGLQLDMKQGDVSVQGKLATPVSLDMEKSRVALPQLAGSFTVSGPDLPNKSIQLALGGSAEASWGGKSGAKKGAQADLTARFDESNAKLKLAIADFARLAPQFDLAVDRLNVDRYTGGEKRAAASQGGGDGKARKASAPASEEPIDLSALKSLNASGHMRFGSMVASKVKAQNLQLTLKAADGRVDLNPISAQLYQGTASGAVSVNANGNRFAIRQQLSNVSVGPLLRDAADKDILEGRGSIVLDVVTAGNTLAALKRGLNGKASLKLRDGAIKGIDLGAIARRARTLRSGNLESAASAKIEKTDFSELTAGFAISNGVARNEDLSAKSPFIRIAGAGDVDVGAGSLDYLVKASIVGTSTGQEGKALADVRGLTFPVRLKGPFDNMKYSVDAGAVAAEAVKGEIRKRLEDSVSKGRLGDALKGIFGR